MGKIPLGILGPVSGKVGTVIGSTYKGAGYLRAVSGKPSKPATPAQMAVRTKFKLASDVVTPLTPFIATGYAAHTRKITQRNMAMKQVINHCIDGDYPDFRVDYSMVKLAAGTLPGVNGGALSSTGTNTVGLRWSYDATNPLAKPTDYLMVGIFCPRLGEAVVRGTLEVRENEEVQLVVPAHFSGHEVHVWAAFVDTDAMMVKARPEAVSNSAYLGSLTIL
jgi:hypothetical protein